MAIRLSRREFFPAAAAGLSASPRIRRIEVFPVAYPVVAHFKFLGPAGRPAVFVKITSEGGLTGWGQSVPLPTWSYETPESVISTIEKHLAPGLVGRDPLDIAGAHVAMNRAIAPSFSTGMPIAKAGVDLALHDLAGRLRQQSVAASWGRKPQPRLTLSWTVNPTAFAETERLVEEGRTRGYRHFNTKVAPDPKFDIELCRRVRRLAPECFLWADANGGYDLDAALAVAPKLAAAVELYCAYGLTHPVALNAPQFLTGSYLKKPLAVKNGEIEFQAGAGLGVEVDEERLRRQRR